MSSTTSTNRVPLKDQVEILKKLKEFALNIRARSWEEAAILYVKKHHIQNYREAILWYGKLLDSRPENDMFDRVVESRIISRKKKNGTFERSPKNIKVGLGDLKGLEDFFGMDTCEEMMSLRAANGYPVDYIY